jgi:hypothetical protein
MTRDPDDRSPTTAQGSETLLGALDEAADAGYDTQFIAQEDGLVMCVDCASTNPPASFDTAHFRRLEGASDPDDMLIVVWSACPTCGAHGTLTLGFGPNASGADASVLALLDLHGADASQPLDQARAAAAASNPSRMRSRPKSNSRPKS